MRDGTATAAVPTGAVDASSTVTVSIPRAGFEASPTWRWRTVPGTYEGGLGPDVARLPITLPTPAP